MLGKHADQHIHLVGQNVAILQDQAFLQRRGIRNVEQFHLGLFRGARTFAMVAPHARRGHVAPDVLSALRQGHDMIACEVSTSSFAAIRADVSVTDEKSRVGESDCRFAPSVWIVAPQRGNATDRDLRELSGASTQAACEGELEFTELACHAAGHFMRYRLLPRHPGKRIATGV